MTGPASLVAQPTDSAELVRALSDAAFEAVVIHREGVIFSANAAAEALVGVAHGALVGRALLEFVAPECRGMVLERMRSGDVEPYESFALRADGKRVPIEARSRQTPLTLADGSYRVVALRDLTERKRAEEQLHRAHKLEAVGRLAGGVAQDYNNLLSVILGTAGLMAESLGPDHPHREDLQAIIDAGERAASLTRQLLAFGRKQLLRPALIDASTVVRRLEPLVRRALPRAVNLEIRGVPEARIEADPTQLELVLLELVVNARDSMPDGGSLQIEVSVGSGGPDARALVIIEVSDTGEGMDAQTRERLFEPFFTTRHTRQGSGLGLAAVFGWVEQTGGTIEVDSELGRGSRFRLAFPHIVPPAAE